ncbi:MAG: hypothetical protein HYY29_03600 [Chloroflexi bacterium]|nr:hypothetical protein [Chloroflexota bacterium]
MIRAVRQLFLIAVIGIMGYWLLMVAADVYQAGVLGMVDLRDSGIMAMLIYLAVMEL